jgi:hypothetical protein
MGIRFDSDDGREVKFTGLFADCAVFLNFVEQYYSSEFDEWFVVPVFDLTRNQVGEILTMMASFMVDCPSQISDLDRCKYQIVKDWYAKAGPDDVMPFG